MTIWVDADACPNVVKEILFKAAKRAEINVVFVANQFLRLPPSPWLQMQQVESGFDVADDKIVEQVQAGDLVITSDIPLAAEVIEKKALVITPRGEPYTPQNIGQRLNMRDFMETMRSSAIQVGGGPPPMDSKDKQAFANALDRYISKAKNA
ncbi:MAG: YaiI/YqxD family protein [Pseudomonadales bacterium]|nr:YaiI/YqxD family protein [Pseudomonadales bacterium]